MKANFKFHLVLLLLLAIVVSTTSFAQETKDDLTRLENGEDVNVLYRNEANYSIFMHSAGGFGLAYRRGVHVTGKRKRVLEIEMSNFKHYKEVKSVNSYYSNSKGFVYGKLNSILLFRSGVGFQNAIYQKNDKKNVEIRYSYFLGATLGVAKPIYLEVRKANSVIPSTERYDPTIHRQENIYGKASFVNGLDKTRIYPAGYAKFALSFEYGERYNAVKALEVGVVADIYPVAMPIMANYKKQQVYASFYLKMIWGKKWF